MIGFVASTVSMTATSIEMIDFIASTISTKSSLSATSAFHGGGVGAGVLGGAGTGVTHTDTTAATTTATTVPGMGTAIAGGLGWASFSGRCAAAGICRGSLEEYLGLP